MKGRDDEPTVERRRKSTALPALLGGDTRYKAGGTPDPGPQLVCLEDSYKAGGFSSVCRHTSTRCNLPVQKGAETPVDRLHVHKT